MGRGALPRRAHQLLAVWTVVFALTGCGEKTPSQGAGVSTSAPESALPHGWEGAAGLDRAKAEGKPTLLYISSTWCPPCQALEANVLSKEAFFNSTTDFVRVRVDGDSEGAQAVIEKFEAWAYPTVLVLSPDGGEVYRAHHTVSLNELLKALALARGTSTAFEQAVSELEKGMATVKLCPLFAATSWSSVPIKNSTDRSGAALRAFDLCKGVNPVAGAALAAEALALASMRDMYADSTRVGNGVKARAGELLQAIFATSDTQWAARTFITSWVKVFVRWHLEDDREAPFQNLKKTWLEAARNIADRSNSPVDVALLAELPAVEFYRLENAGAAIDPVISERIYGRVKRLNSMNLTAAERHATMGNAAYLLRSIGKKALAVEMLIAETQKSDSPSHYLTTLSQWAKEDGQIEQARQWAREASTRERGRSSKIQWLANECDLYKDDEAQVNVLVERAAEAYTLIFARKDAFLGRDKTRAHQLAAALKPWAKRSEVVKLVEKFAPKCGGVDLVAHAECEAHFELIQGK
ncbi:MAG: thioredoxin family protein [Polyangiaceae bacterium]|nr:thioredoxin family protein [Polyangiaceae bacterium]